MNFSRITKNHFNIFLLDAIGAFLSIFLLLFVVMANEIFFGLSKSLATNLVIPILGLLIFSTSCFFLKPQNWKLLMKFVVLGNVSYCLFILATIFLNFKQLTILGVSYFLIELLIICFLIGIEIMTIRR